MNLLNVKKIEENGALVTYELTIDLGDITTTAQLLTDRDGNHAEWLNPVVPSLEVGEGQFWDELVSQLDDNPQVAADVEAYYED